MFAWRLNLTEEPSTFSCFLCVCVCARILPGLRWDQRWCGVVRSASLPILFTFVSLQAPFVQIMKQFLVSYKNNLVWNQQHRISSSLLFRSLFCLYPSLVFTFTTFYTHLFLCLLHSLLSWSSASYWCLDFLARNHQQPLKTEEKKRRTGAEEKDRPWFTQVRWNFSE